MRLVPKFMPYKFKVLHNYSAILDPAATNRRILCLKEVFKRQLFIHDRICKNLTYNSAFSEAETERQIYTVGLGK